MNPPDTTTDPTLHDRVRLHALETFGQDSSATHWMNRPNRLFGGKTPLQTLETDPESVDEELTRIDHGIFV